jgi:radical SAM protein with 4Fe4S-binding SPASM domain
MHEFLLKDSEFRLCGGEPSLHDNVIEICDWLLKNNRKIFLMTNGLWPNEFWEYISSLEYKYITRIRFLFNVLEKSLYKNGEFQQLNKSLSVVNSCNTTLGITIYKGDFDFKTLISLALKYNIRRIRWSIAAPTVAKNHNDIEKQFNLMAERLCVFYNAIRDMNLIASNDCGYLPLCVFNDEQFSFINKISSRSIKTKCEGSPSDIDNNGASWRCYGLFSILKTNIQEFKNELELLKFFDRRVKLLNNLFAYSECKTCKFWQHSCGGGCYAIRIKKALSQNPKICLFPIDDDTEILKCCPKIRKDLTIKKSDHEVRILFDNSVIVNPNENILAYIDTIDGNLSVSDLIDLWSKNYSSYNNVKNAVVDLTRQLFEQDIISVNYDFKVEYPSIEIFSTI